MQEYESPQLEDLYRGSGPILIRGKPGCGRRGLARRIHGSCAGDRPFVIHDCDDPNQGSQRRALLGEFASLAPGHYLRYLGVLEKVGEGTLLLDRVEQLDPTLQEELADIVEQGFFFPIHGDEPVAYRGRTIVTTTMDLSQMAKAGAFSHRLLAQLSAHPITIES